MAGNDDDFDKKSVASTTSKSSKYSVKSFMSKASSMSASVKRGLSAFKPSSRTTTASVAAMVELLPGDTCETLSLVTIRLEESLDSALVAELPPGQTVEVTEVGQGRRIKIKTTTGIEGWISSKTKFNEPLVMKRRPEVDMAMDGWEIGVQHEVKSMVTVRADENLDSDIISELKPGAIFTIKELGASNKRRALVDSGVVVGWISLVTKQGEVLVGKVSSKEKDRPAGMFGTSSLKIKEMLESARAGDLEALKKVVEPGSGIMSKFSNKPNLNASDIRGKTALIYAAGFGNQEVVEFLLGKEIEVNAVDDTDKTALHHAARRTGSEEDSQAQADIISAILHAKAYLEARDHNGCTALMFAVANGNEAIVRRLVQAQANVNIADYENHTCLSYAKQFGQNKIVSLLKRAGARERINLDEDEEEEEDVSSPKMSMRASAAPGRKLPDPTEETSGADSFSTAVPTQSPDATFESTASSGMQGAAGAAAAGAAAAAAAGAEAEVSPTKKKSVKKKAAPKAEGEEAADNAEGAAASPKKKKPKDKDAEKTETADKKKKKKTEPKKKLSATGMLEAVAGEKETAVAVTVEADVTEEVDTKARALTKLKAVMESTESPKELDQCIKAAKAEGATDEEVADAVKVLKALKAKGKAREELSAAVEARDVARLVDALGKAKKLQVPNSDIAEAEKVLADEKPKQEARDKLKAAKDAGDASKLKAAIEEALKAGLRASETAEYEELLAGAESKEKAEAALRAAVQERNVAGLKFAIQQAKEAGISSDQIAKAEEVLKVEEPKHKAREQLQEACSNVTKAGLQAAVAEAKRVGLEATEYAEASQLLEKEAKKEQLLKLVNEALESSQQVDMKDIDALREAKQKLSAAIQDALKVGVPEADVSAAEMRRKKLHNCIEDLKGSIRVFCRVRPLSKKETGQGDTNICEAEGSMTIKVKEQKFSFDAVFSPGSQEEVFEDCKDLVQSAADGYNVTMFAYGQTGAGKTYTMYGAAGNEGTAPRTIDEVFKVTEQGSDRFNYTVMGSMLELYCNGLVDLLAKGDDGAAKSKLNVRQDKSGSIIVEHLTEETCHSPAELSELLERGEKHRTVASTAMNADSSRSHLVLIIKIISVNKETKEQLRGKILLCDLAGSERLKKSEVTDKQQKEAIEINKSLTALGDVIEALTNGGKSMVPYRNHKLTQLMQDSLGGSAKTLMFVNCSPASSNVDETFMSLKYAQRAKKITNTATKKS
eukprot:TRINITY_DN36762_c0_g1_i1.p1 TRINITY_DN36762_c0_g1~~TRINITY_DN36762_c0_g1_i1.p1  ORF type:complete len:1235 (+),score=381.11 TRINITY_DN36762_c0_g1_i1:89-3793(+)